MRNVRTDRKEKQLHVMLKALDELARGRCQTAPTRSKVEEQALQLAIERYVAEGSEAIRMAIYDALAA